MGDRSNLETTIHKLYFARLKSILGLDDQGIRDKFGIDEIEGDDDTVTLTEWEASYGMNEELDNCLAEHMIESNIAYSRGWEYEAGDKYSRIIDGQMIYMEIIDSQYEVYRTLETLIKDNLNNNTKLYSDIEAKMLSIMPFQPKPLKIHEKDKNNLNDIIF